MVEHNITPMKLHTAMFCLSILLGAACTNAHAQKTTITVQATQPGKAISPDLFGIFFEDLNYAADGGLYAELVQNRSFEYDPAEQGSWNPLSFWELVKRGGGAGGLGVKMARPINKNNLRYAVLTVDKPGEGVGLANGGIDGIPLIGGDAYQVSFFACQLFMNDAWGPDNKIAGRPMPVTVRLEARNGDLLGEASMEVAGREWQHLAAKITPSRTENAARLVLLAKAKGGIALDEISLFPTKTFHDRPNGLRADLAQVIADLKPKFMRFPGGCLVHGDSINNFYNWKDTIGPVEQRKGQRNAAWGYHQSVGLGYYECFQFCEDIGAKPLPVVAAGVCCQHGGGSPNMGQEGLPLNEMDPYIQDVLDLVEWANGPATSPWGSKRAAAGHPEPFGLKYLGVGNEDAITPVFKERFKMIYEAVKAKYPDIVVVGTVGPFPDGEDFEKGWKFAKELNLPMVDEHYYKGPQWFWDHLQRYDRYNRAEAKVFAGEYAAHEKDRRNTLRSALAEAAGMTSFERNGDVVHFASYAPLLARRDHTRWTPDMIYFTGNEVFLTANYYVQQLFSANSGDTYLDTTLSGSPQPRTLAASSVRDSKSGDLIVKIVNGVSSVSPLNIQLAGVPSGDYKVSKTVLGGGDADAVNEDGKPPVVKPETSEFTVKPPFDYEAPANSLTIFRIKK
jgi:alpha-L-arabinofuranosidase